MCGRHGARPLLHFLKRGMKANATLGSGLSCVNGHPNPSMLHVTEQWDDCSTNKRYLLIKQT